MSIDRPAEPSRIPPPASRRLRQVVVIAAITLALALGGVTAFTKRFQDAATGIFSKIVDAVKDHPHLTLVLCVGAVALAWVAIAAIAAGQELRCRQLPPASNDPANKKPANKEPSKRAVNRAI